jgi:hypothetical protein
VLDKHGAANVSSGSHFYVAGGKYLSVTSTDPALSDHRLTYETDAAGKVTSFRAGRMPEVRYVEGCS